MSTAADPGPVIVVKYGGAAFDDGLLSGGGAKNLAELTRTVRRLLIVHGGGPVVTKEAERRGLPVRFVDGQRITDEAMMDVVRMVLVGRVNKDLVGQLGQAGVRAVGLCGQDGELITARKLLLDGATALGHIGEVERVRTDVLEMVWRADMLPVVASVAADKAGVPHNINADTVAGELAAALPADRLVFVTDVDGLLRDPADPASRIAQMTDAELAVMLSERSSLGGMLPKMRAALTALRAGVRQVRIIDGRHEDAVLLAATTADLDLGTTVLSTAVR